MALINAEKVHELIANCLFTEDEQAAWEDPKRPPKDATIVYGLVRNFAFHTGRLESNRDEVKSLLLNLPSPFMQSVGGGFTFLNMPSDKKGNLWGEQHTAESLLVLGLGLGLAKYCAPRSMWNILPGGVPYIVVMDVPPKDAKVDMEEME